VVDKLRWRRQMAVEEFTYLRGRTKKPVKVTLVSAQQAAAYYDPEKSKAAYPTRDAYLADLVDFTRREIAELTRLGCEYIQIDAPQYAALLDETIREGYRQRGSDPDRMLDATVELDNAIVQGHRGVTFGIHICRGNHKSMFYASGGYDRIAEKVFGRSKFDRFLLEYDDARSGTFEPLRYLPDDRVVVLGLVSSKKAQLETAANIKPAVRIRVDGGRQRAVGRRAAEEARAGRVGSGRRLGLTSSMHNEQCTMNNEDLHCSFHRAAAAGMCRCTTARATNVTQSAAVMSPKNDVLPR
jgi:5-methyltetrahydropteroyltriglutamate--homocysteine methyltransferase